MSVPNYKKKYLDEVRRSDPTGHPNPLERQTEIVSKSFPYSLKLILFLDGL